MDILVVCLTANRLFDQAVRRIFHQSYDQSHRLDVLFLYRGDGHVADVRDRITYKYNQARETFLAGTWDALWTVESDMLVPLDAVEKLIAADADVAYGLYCLRRPPYEWNAYSAIDGMVAWSLCVAPERARADWGSVVDVDGIGLGCTLIKRRVLERVAFRAEGDVHQNGERSHCDWYFAVDCLDAGFTQKCHTGVVCGHITEWDEDGKSIRPSVIWPDIAGVDDHLYRFEEF